MFTISFNLHTHGEKPSINTFKTHGEKPKTMEPSNYDQLQGKRNARAWKRQFKVVALGKGVWDVFNGVYTAVTCPDPKDYGLENAQNDATKPSDDQKVDKGKRKVRATLGPEEVNEFIKQAAQSAADQKKGLDFNSRMTLYKFTLDEYDKGRKTIATAMALLITWVHSSLRGQLESFDDPKEAYDHLITRYSVTDARAREMAENQFNSIYVTRFTSAQDYINAIENAKQDILEAGGYCDDPMMISKTIRGLRGHPMYKDFATQYHLLRDIDPKFEDLDHVITQLLTFESSNFPEPDFRGSAALGNRFVNRSGFGSNFPEADFRGSAAPGNRFVNRSGFGMREQRTPREKCTNCGVWGHNEATCNRKRPEQRPQNNGYAGQSGRPGNATNGSGNNLRRGTKPNGMAAAAIVDKNAFQTALKHARSMNSFQPLKGTTDSIPSPEIPAEDISQSTSLERFGSEGEPGGEEGCALKGEGVQECCKGVVFNNNCPLSAFDNNSPNTCSHNKKLFSTNQHRSSIPQIEIKNRFAALDPNTSLENNDVESQIYGYLDVEDAFIHGDITEDTMMPSFQINKVCLATTNAPVHPSSWILDSGANVYICNDPSKFTELHTFETMVSTAGQGSAMPIIGGGTVQLDLIDGDGELFRLMLNDVAYAPTSRCNLVSISKLAQAGIHGSWESWGTIMELQSQDGYVIGTAQLCNGLYHLQLIHAGPQTDSFVANVDFDDPVWKEHRRLGHLSLQRMLTLCSQSVGMNVTKGQIQAKVGQICPICATTRAIVRIPRDPARVRYDEKGQLLHVDIWGPYPVVGWDGTRWMVFSTDDATRTTKTLRLKTLSEFPQLLREFHKREERKYQIMILRYRVDNQFNQGPWKEWCKKKGITIEPIAPHAHHQVGVAERVNRTLREGASAMIQDNAIGRQVRRIIEERGNEFLRNSTLPEVLWPEAVDYAAWLKNRTPTRALKSMKTPWEMEEGHIPDLSREKTWGSRVYVSYTNEERSRKLHDPRGWIGYFVGCENESTYRVWDPDNKKIKRVVYTVVEDGQGLDDTHIEGNINNRIVREPMERVDIENASDASSDEDKSIRDNSIESDDDEESDRGIARNPRRNMETSSRFFPNHAAMVTQRSAPLSPYGSVNVDQALTPPRPALIRDGTPIRDRSPIPTSVTPNIAFEETYVPPLGDTLRQERSESPEGFETSPFFAGESANNEQEQDESPSDQSPDSDPENLLTEVLQPSPYSAAHNTSNSDDRENVEQNPPSGEDVWSDPSDIGSNGNKIFESRMPLPPIPSRLAERRTANQLPMMSDSEQDDIDRGRNCKPYTQRTCGNEHCSSPNAPVGPTPKGPNNELLCNNCDKRYKGQLKSKLSREPDAWKVAGLNKSRKGMTIRKPKPKKELESSESDDEKLTGKRDENRRGTRIKARVPDKDRCQCCFDYAKNCQMGDDGQCSQCKASKRICRPLKLNQDGTLPTERRFSTAPLIHDNAVSWDQRCYTCRERNRKCDATQPIDPKIPCSSCKTLNSYCISMEQAERARNNPACLRCTNMKRKGMCNRGEPCDICINDSHARCTYETEDKTRWFTSLTNPVPPDRRTNSQDPNVDYYNPNVARPGCIHCQKYYSENKQRRLCTFQPGGPPCWQCFDRTSTNADRCTNWIAPGKLESVATRMYMLDGTTGDLVRDPTKTKNETLKKRGRKIHSLGDMSTSDSNSDTDFETAHARIMTEDSRQATRQRLMNHTLPEAFVTALSLTALQDPVNNALRPDPQSYTEAMKSPDSRKWVEAIQAEYDSLMENGTWKVAVLPAGRKALTTKWVLKKKLGPAGEIVKYKARMVARGFQQVEGYDYTETYSGVVKAAAYRLLFALTVLNGWTCHQMDVATAFLNGDVLEEIYIHPPQGYPHPGKVLRLLKALYGLKQSPRLWYRKLRQWLLDNGWEISKYDECVFYNKARQLIMTVYVDDINIFGPSDDHINSFKKEIARAFKMTDAGRASWYLGMQLVWLAEGLHIHQNGFIQQALGRYGLLGSKAAAIPLDPSRKLFKETENTADPKFKTAYMSMVGSLNYLQTKTVWGLAFPVSLVSRFMTNPNKTHMDAVLQEFRYLAGTPQRGLLFRKDGDSTLRGFVDSDWGGDTDTGKSTTGWVFTLAGSPISWASQRQKTVSSSSTEAEYIAASDACKEAIWLKGFHNEIAPRMNYAEQKTIPLAIDNASALKLTKNPEFHGRTKHINIRHHFIRECVENGDIIPEWISGKTNPADLFTKPLSKPLFRENIERLGGGLPISFTSGASKAPDKDV